MMAIISKLPDVSGKTVLSTVEGDLLQKITVITGASARLARFVRELSIHLDTVDEVIGALDNDSVKSSLSTESRTHREVLENASIVLANEARKLPPLYYKIFAREP